MASAEVVANVAKEKKPRASKGSKPPPSHPTYLQMITEAITVLKERTGSSHHAIAHYIDGKYKTHLPANYRKLLTAQLRNLAKSGKLSKVKGSFKIPAELNKPTKTVKAKAAKPATAAKAPLKKPASAKPKPVSKAVAKPKPAAKAVAKPKAAVSKVAKAPKKVGKPAAKKVAAAPKKAAAAVKKAVKPAAKKAAAPKKATSVKTPKKAKK